MDFYPGTLNATPDKRISFIKRRQMKLLHLIICLMIIGKISPPLAIAEDSRRYRVGVLVPLSGSLAPMGEAFRRGIELSQKDGAADHVQFMFEDHKYDGKTALTALHKLRGLDGIDLAVVWGNTPSGSCAPVAEQQEIPMLAVSMNPDAKGRRYVTTFGPPIESLIDRVAKQFEDWNLKEPGAVSVDLGNALIGIEMLRKQLDGKLLVKTIASDESDFKTLIAGLKSKGVDGLLLFATPEQALTFLRQSKSLHFFPKIIGGDVFAELSFHREALQLTQNLAFVYGAVDARFIKRLADIDGSPAYFFEVASGYALASMAEHLAMNVQKGSSKADPLSFLATVDLSKLPLPQMRFLEDSDYGRHFEVEGKVYPVPLEY